MMSPVTAAAFRRPGMVPMDQGEVSARSVRRRVGATWALLYFNTLTFYPGMSILSIPHKVGQLLTQGALTLAILVALTVNPKVKVRPNVFLCLVSLLVVDTVITAASPQHFGTVYRTVRLAEFVAVLWLLTPWWGRRDMLLLRCHLRCNSVMLGSVLLGLLVAPGHAIQFGRLNGVIWPSPPPQVAHYAAVVAGLTAVLWLARLLSGRAALAGVTVAVTILLLAHTRTALAGLVAGFLVAGLSLFTINSRVRKSFAAGAVAVSVGIMTVGGVVTAWLARGEGTNQLGSLTGRTALWALVANLPRNGFQEIFGFGLSNASVNGLSIDSNWYASYLMEGIFGVVTCAMMLAWVLVIAFFQPRGVGRALALFLVTYCMLASYTEVGITDASTYLLDLGLAASLLIGPSRAREQHDDRGGQRSRGRLARR
jgi:hypothetical protein